MTEFDETVGKPVTDDRAWRSADFTSESDWVTRMSPEEIKALEQAAGELPGDRRPRRSWLAFFRIVDDVDQLTRLNRWLWNSQTGISSTTAQG